MFPVGWGKVVSSFITAMLLALRLVSPSAMGGIYALYFLDNFINTPCLTMKLPVEWMFCCSVAVFDSPLSCTHTIQYTYMRTKDVAIAITRCHLACPFLDMTRGAHKIQNHREVLNNLSSGIGHCNLSMLDWRSVLPFPICLRKTLPTNVSVIKSRLHTRAEGRVMCIIDIKILASPKQETAKSFETPWRMNGRFAILGCLTV